MPLIVILIETRLMEKFLSEMGCHGNKTMKDMALTFRLGNGSDLRWPWPAAAWSKAWVPSQRLRPGHGSEGTRS